MTSPDDTIQVQVVFTVEEEGYPSYRDAIYVPLADYPTLEKSGEIERLKTERWEAWRKLHDNPPPAPEVVVPSTDEALTQARQALADATAALDAVAAAPVVFDPDA